MSVPTLEVENLGKRYRLGRMTPRQSIARVMGLSRTSHPENHHWALRGVSFTLNRGDVLGVVGANGAGKSTLLKLMSRITRPTEGRAVIRGRVGSLLEVGTGFHPELTGMENVFINGAILGMTRKEIKARLADILEFAGIGRYIDTPVKRYSSGMYTRLAFAIAAHLEPEVLIVDEVLAVGDQQFQTRCLDKMRDAAASGRTILFVSHGAANVQKLCNKALLLESGAPTAFGDVQTVLDAYTPPPPPPPPAHAVIALAAPDRPGDVTATQLSLFGPDGQPTTRVPVGAPWSVQLAFTAHRPIQAFVAGLGLNTAAGDPACTAWTRPTNLTPGPHLAHFTFEGTLKASGFTFNVGLTDATQSHHYVQGVGAFEIGPAATDDAPHMPHHGIASGLLVHRGHAQIVRADAPPAAAFPGDVTC